MKLLVLLTVTLLYATLCTGRHGKHHHHHHKVDKESESEEQPHGRANNARNQHSNKGRNLGRGFFGANMLGAIFQKHKGNIAGGHFDNVPSFKGPIEQTPMYKKALENPHFAEDVKNYNSCRGKPTAPNMRLVQASVKCSNGDKDYACYKTCIFEEIGITVDEKYSIAGTNKFLEDKMKCEPEKARKEVQKAFFQCFEEGTKLMLRSPNCSKNQKVLDCLKAIRAKMCDTQQPAQDKTAPNEGTSAVAPAAEPSDAPNKE